MGVTSGSFAIPNEGETSDNVWYRLILSVTDSRGLVGKDSVDILPQKSTITITTNPPGLEVSVDGQPFPAPLTVTSVEGMLRTFGVATPQILDDAEYEFESWSNEGDMTQTFSTPAEDLQLVANFSIVVGTEKNFRNDDTVLYPNPTKEDVVTVKILLKQPGKLSIQLIDLLSHELSVREEILSAGEHVLPFTIGKRSKGVYSIIVKSYDKTIVKKLVVTE